MKTRKVFIKDNEKKQAAKMGLKWGCFLDFTH